MYNKQAIGTAFAMALFVFTVADVATIWRLHHHAASSKAEQVIMSLMDEDRGEVSKTRFMQFMAAEFDRLDVRGKGSLTRGDLSRSALSAAGKRPEAVAGSDLN